MCSDKYPSDPAYPWHVAAPLLRYIPSFNPLTMSSDKFHETPHHTHRHTIPRQQTLAHTHARVETTQCVVPRVVVACSPSDRQSQSH